MKSSCFFRQLVGLLCVGLAVATVSSLQAHPGHDAGVVPASVSPTTADGPYHVGLDFIDSIIDPAPETFFPCIEGLPSSCNGFAPFELTTPSSNFVTQGGLAGWTEEDARRAVAIAVDDIFRDLDVGDSTKRVQLSIHLGAVPTNLNGQRLNVMLGQVSDTNYSVSLLGTTGGGGYSDPLMNDQIVAATYLHNIEDLGNSFVTYDTSEAVVNAVAGTAAHEIGHVFGIGSHVETLPTDTEPYPLVSSEADGLPTSARLTARRFSTTKPAGTSNAERVYQNAGLATIGDFNFDSLVDGSDAGVMFGNWGMVDRLYNEGDALGDHMIDAADAGIVFGNWTGDPGPAAPGMATAEYDPVTGEISVSVNSVVNWYIEQEGGSVMTGPDSGASLLPLAGGLVSDSDVRIGETTFSAFSYDVNLGAVAETGLANDGTLKIFWNAGLGGALQQALISFAIVPEPTAIVLGLMGVASLLSVRRRHVA